MARRKGRTKDKWREKRWITVNAPESFNVVPIAYVPITDDENAIGRVLEVTLYDILKGDPSPAQNNIYKIKNKLPLGNTLDAWNSSNFFLISADSAAPGTNIKISSFSSLVVLSHVCLRSHQNTFH